MDTKAISELSKKILPKINQLQRLPDEQFGNPFLMIN